MTLPDLASSLTPVAARKQAETTFGEKLESWIHKAGCKVVDVERGLGLGDAKIYRFFRGTEHFRAAALSCLPPAVEMLYLAERAAAHGRELRHVSDEGHAASFHSLLLELTDVTRAACTTDADGVATPAEATVELAEIEQLESALASRKAFLRRAVSERGARLRTVGK